MSMKKGINAWCFPANMSIQDIFALAAEENYDGIEVNMSGDGKGKAYLTIENWEEDCEELAALSKKYSLPIYSISSGYFWGYPLTDDDPAKVGKAKTAVCRMLDAAAAVEADTILTVPGLVTPTVSYRTAYQRAQSAYDELKEYAEGVKVTIRVIVKRNFFNRKKAHMMRLGFAFHMGFAIKYYNVLLNSFLTTKVKNVNHLQEATLHKLEHYHRG